MKVLIVGPGAVGQVFGLHLQKTGVELGFYARAEKTEHLSRALERGGLQLHQFSHFHRRVPVSHRLANYQVITDIAGSQAFQPDQVWFTTPSTVFYSEWFQDFIREVPCDSIMVFAPEGARAEHQTGVEVADRMVYGSITFIAWVGDLDGVSDRSESVNFWQPPLLQMPLTGGERASAEVLNLLKKCGFRPAVKKDGFHQAQASTSALMTAVTAGLELSGWSFSAYRRGPWLEHAARGGREGVLSQLDDPGWSLRLMFRLLGSPLGFGLVTGLLPTLFPFDLEKFLKLHYTKVREQSINLLEIYIRDGIKRGSPVDHLQTLLKGLLDSG